MSRSTNNFSYKPSWLILNQFGHFLCNFLGQLAAESVVHCPASGFCGSHLQANKTDAMKRVLPKDCLVFTANKTFCIELKDQLEQAGKILRSCLCLKYQKKLVTVFSCNIFLMLL